MDYSKFSARELRALLISATDNATKEEIKKAIEAFNTAFTERGGMVRPESRTVFGMVGHTSRTDGGNLRVSIILKGDKRVVSELNKNQQDQIGGNLETGDIVSVQVEQRVKGITQYKDQDGNMKYHGEDITDMTVGTKYESIGLVSLSSEKALKNYNLLNS